MFDIGVIGKKRNTRERFLTKPRGYVARVFSNEKTEYYSDKSNSLNKNVSVMKWFDMYFVITE